MAIIQKLQNLPSGACFYRADLHIHSLGASHDVSDTTSTPHAIVQAARNEHLDLIAITDHNEISNALPTVQAAAGTPLVILGTELSTANGHLLAYFPDPPSLNGFFGRLTIADSHTPTSRCQTSLLDCLNLVNQFKGFAILAHIDKSGSFEDLLPGYPVHKIDILAHPALVAIEITNPNNRDLYSIRDPKPEGARVSSIRKDRMLGELAHVCFSDTHKLSQIGRNIKGEPRITRVKMDKPSFDGLRIALQDPSARVRMEEDVPQSIPFVMGISLEGGFLDGQQVHLSRNLNCIIGGRGTGKSTLLEAVRCATSHSSDSRLIDSEIWPNSISLIWVDEAGQTHTVVRRSQESPVNIDDPDLGPVLFPIESYGQGDPAKISAKAQSDPEVLLKYLDEFVEIDDLTVSEETVRGKLLQNQTSIEKAELEVAKIPQYQRILASTKQQLAVLEKAKAKDIVVLERKVAEERSLRESIDTTVNSIKDEIKQPSLQQLLDALQAAVKTDGLRIGTSECKAILSLLSGLQTRLNTVNESITQDTIVFSKQVKDQLGQWKMKEKAILDQIDQKKRELASQGVSLDRIYIQKLASDEATYTKALRTLETWKTHLISLRAERTQLLQERRTLRSKITTTRMAYVQRATKELQGALGDLNVSVKIVPDGYSPEAEAIIQEAMGWRTIQVPRAAILVQNVTVPRLLESIYKKDTQTITEVNLEGGEKPFNSATAKEIIERLNQPAYRYSLERCFVNDRPKITVSKTIPDGDGKPRTIIRDFARLSLGQQASVLLALMLLSESTKPLVIDQPEDNLDGEFIYHALVTVLRKAKERRQIIVVTHNANIAVLGDAEQVIALKSSNDAGVIVSRGSIDDPEVKKIACKILEGAEEAFVKRAKIYGLPRSIA